MCIRDREKAYVDKWMINAAVHYNEWANFKKNDFLPLIESYENLLREFYCNNCGSAYFINDNINEQELRCSCNKNPINLIPKK